MAFFFHRLYSSWESENHDEGEVEYLRSLAGVEGLIQHCVVHDLKGDMG